MVATTTGYWESKTVDNLKHAHARPFLDEFALIRTFIAHRMPSHHLAKGTIAPHKSCFAERDSRCSFSVE
jgi:hypothetical protein